MPPDHDRMPKRKQWAASPDATAPAKRLSIPKLKTAAPAPAAVAPPTEAPAPLAAQPSTDGASVATVPSTKPEERKHPVDRKVDDEIEHMSRNPSGMRGRKLLARCNAANTRVDIVARAVLLALFLHENKERVAHQSASIDTLADELCTDRNVIARALERLQTAGIITTERKRKWNGGVRHEHTLVDTQGDTNPDPKTKARVRARQKREKRSPEPPHPIPENQPE